MESIRELRMICQASRRQSDGWHMKHIARKPSIYITWLLLHTPISANGVTFLMVVIGWLACGLFLIGTKASFLSAALCLQLWYIIDMVDGEVARYRKQPSLTGVYFDGISHYLVHPFVFVSIGIGLYNHGAPPSILLVSFLAAYSSSMITILLDTFNSSLFIALQQRPADANVSLDTAVSDNVSQGNIFKKIFSVLHLLCVFPAVMNIILLIAIASYVFSMNIFIAFLYIYSCAATVVWVLRVAVFIRTRKIDEALSRLRGVRNGGKL